MSTEASQAQGETSPIAVRDVAEVRRWSHGVVSVVESIRFDVFRAGVVSLVLASVLTAALLPTRQAISGTSLTVAMSVSVATVAAALLVLVWPLPSYRALSDSPLVQWIVALIATAQISAVLP
ncbi:MAG: hypothetical protein ACRDQZ_18660, partial [Mycobacteriales bacterium]